MTSEVKGILTEPRRIASGAVYQGRLALQEVQWTGRGAEIFGTATVTLAELADAAESNMLWTDQSVQRGINPAAPSGTPRVLELSSGYPDKRYYIFDADNADDMTQKLLHGERLFFNPLVWNLRPGTFEGYAEESPGALYLYRGKIYLPDSHHRHQAILKAVRAYYEHPSSFPKFDLGRQFKVELYFLDREDEGNYFFDKNQRPKPTALSKAYDLTTEDDLSTLAKMVLDRSPRLNAGTNRTTDRLSKKAPHFVTLSTLREVMRTFAGSTEVDDTELEGLALVAAEFFEMLAEVRPELSSATAQSTREESLASQAVMMHGYAVLMREFNLDLGNQGPTRARATWAERLGKLSPYVLYAHERWTGDFLSKRNPLWSELGVVREHPETHRLTVSNTGGARALVGRALLRRVTDESVARRRDG